MQLQQIAQNTLMRVSSLLQSVQWSPRLSLRQSLWRSQRLNDPSVQIALVSVVQQCKVQRQHCCNEKLLMLPTLQSTAAEMLATFAFALHRAHAKVAVASRQACQRIDLDGQHVPASILAS